mgnify:CR=1 FL=1
MYSKEGGNFAKMILSVLMQNIVRNQVGGANSDEKKQIMIFLVQCVVIIVVCSFIYYYIYTKFSQFDEQNQKRSLMDVLGLSKNWTREQWTVGMMQNFIFGFIDNAGLFFGMEKLDPLFKKFSKGNPLIEAGLGNTFSDFIGAFLGTFLGEGYAIYKGNPETPLLSQAVGIVLGCLVGVALPALYKDYRGELKEELGESVISNIKDKYGDVLKADEELIKQYFKEENYNALNDLESKKFIDNLKTFNGEELNVVITNKEQAELYYPQNPKMFLGKKK